MKHSPLITANIEANNLKQPGDPGMTSHGGRRMKTILMLVAGGALLLLAGCSGHVDSPPVPDLVPIGDGLKVVAYAVVAAAVIVVLGKLLP